MTKIKSVLKFYQRNIRPTKITGYTVTCLEYEYTEEREVGEGRFRPPSLTGSASISQIYHLGASPVRVGMNFVLMESSSTDKEGLISLMKYRRICCMWLRLGFFS